ncbi:MAG: N-6 DNA methylase [Frankiales bacterium]|nr:N-6 DNA methylase [Frankiales bacterium]
MNGRDSGSGVSVRVAGGLLPPDVLSAVLAGSVDGLGSSDFHLGGESPREAAARVWSHLLTVYRRFRDELAGLPEGDAAVGVTRERWLTVLLAELGYGRVPATGAGGLSVGGTAYPVSHVWQSVPMHLLGWGVVLDKRTPGVAGAAHRAPHAMVQELLNRSDQCLWAVVSNGRVLRLLRDSTTLTGQAYVEFDLEAMFDGEVFADFVLLFLLAHQSRVEVPEGASPGECWLERWRTTAVSQGVRALSLLREGVQVALETLGTGFLQHRANGDLRGRLADGDATVQDLHQALLRTVYRLLFWTVVEDRQALLVADDPVAIERYDSYFSSARLRRLARSRHGSAHDDLWAAVTLVLDALGRDGGDPRLGLPGLGGLFAPSEADVLAGARIGNRPLLAAVRALTVVQPAGQPQRLVDFRHLGAEELGGIYESLLELVPRYDPTTHVFTLETAAGNDRKTTGSYYTPTELVELVLDTALDPLLDDAVKAPDPEAALLAVTCCDPAVGSGHFLVAAARRIATRLAAVRTGEVDPTPTTVTDAMHDVVAHCVYGVDLNPMAADLAKVSLWLEAMTPGKPMSFLDHHIKVGNALLGTTPALLAAGIPDEAFVALTGDDKPTARSWRDQNAKERAGQDTLFDRDTIDVGNQDGRDLAAQIADRAAGATLADVAWAAQRYKAGHDSPQQRRARRAADAWCAAFLAPKTPDAPRITTATVEAVAAGSASAEIEDYVDTVAARHRLFHWHLEFPEIFPVPDEAPANTPTGWTGGFTSMLGNPPWETLQMSEREFFATREPRIADAPNAAARKRAIAALGDTNPGLLAEFEVELRRGQVENALIRGGGRFPLCATGKINTYSIFAEHFRSSLAPQGRSGLITPTGLATDATTAAFFADTVSAGRLAAFFDFENGNMFEAVDSRFRFAFSSMTGGLRLNEVALAFFLHAASDVSTQTFSLTPEEIWLLNPNTGTLPVLRHRREAEIMLGIYRRVPVLVRQGGSNPWALRFSQGLFNMASDSAKFRMADELSTLGARFDGWSWTDGVTTWLPLYQGMQMTHWDHRSADVIRSETAQLRPNQPSPISGLEKDDPAREAVGVYWVTDRDVAEAAPSGWARDWFMGFRRLTIAGNERTFIPSVFPRTAVGDNAWVVTSTHPDFDLVIAIWSSYVCDYIVRQKLTGTTLSSYIVQQLACPDPSMFSGRSTWTDEPLADWVRRRVLEMTYTTYRMRGFAVDVLARMSEESVETVDAGMPFRWDANRREILRAELEAAALLVYGLDRAEAEDVLDSFFVLLKYEERDHGEFRTKRLVLAAYDAMAEAARTGVPFASPLDPPPGDGPRHEQPR